MFAQNALSLAIWLPILGAVLVLAIGSDRNAAIARWLSLAVAVATALTIFAPQLLRLGRLVGSALWLLEPDPAAELLVAIPRPRQRPTGLGAIVPASAAAALVAQPLGAGDQRVSLFRREH